MDTVEKPNSHFTIKDDELFKELCRVLKIC